MTLSFFASTCAFSSVLINHMINSHQTWHLYTTKEKMELFISFIKYITNINTIYLALSLGATHPMIVNTECLIKHCGIILWPWLKYHGPNNYSLKNFYWFIKLKDGRPQWRSHRCSVRGAKLDVHPIGDQEVASSIPTDKNEHKNSLFPLTKSNYF